MLIAYCLGGYAQSQPVRHTTVDRQKGGGARGVRGRGCCRVRDGIARR